MSVPEEEQDTDHAEGSEGQGIYAMLQVPPAEVRVKEDIPMTIDEVWKVEKQKDSDSTDAIFKLLIKEYIKIFGSKLMKNEKCIIFNDPNAPCPMLIINQAPTKIRTSLKSPLYWCQNIFQLSHEMCHYAIRQAKSDSDKDYTLSWLEELMCEAMSLYALDYIRTNWGECLLYRKNPNYATSISDYLSNELEYTKEAQVLPSVRTIDEMRECNRTFDSNRKGHQEYRNTLYTKGLEPNPKKAKRFLEYPKYLKGPERLFVDFERWKKDTPDPLIELLESFQPKVEI